MTGNQGKILFGFGLLAMGVAMFLGRKKLGSLAEAALDEVNSAIFEASLPTAARPYSDLVRQVAREQSIDPLLLAALVQRENPWWDPTIVSYDGGYGLTQITSDRAWIERMGDRALDPYENLTRGAQMLNDELNFFGGKLGEGEEATRAALAAYNHGRGAVWSNIQADLSPDTGTTNSYASGTWALYQARIDAFRAGLGIA